MYEAIMEKKPEGESDIELMRRLLKSAGVDVDAAKRKMEREKSRADEKANQTAFEQKCRAEDDAATREAAAEMVRQQNLVISLDGKRTEEAEPRCPHCGDTLHALKEPVMLMARLWRTTPRKLDIMQPSGMPYWITGPGAPVYQAPVKCGHCSKNIEALLQVVF